MVGRLTQHLNPLRRPSFVAWPSVRPRLRGLPVPPTPPGAEGRSGPPGARTGGPRRENATRAAPHPDRVPRGGRRTVLRPGTGDRGSPPGPPGFRPGPASPPPRGARFDRSTPPVSGVSPGISPAPRDIPRLPVRGSSPGRLPPRRGARRGDGTAGPWLLTGSTPRWDRFAPDGDTAPRRDDDGLSTSGFLKSRGLPSARGFGAYRFRPRPGGRRGGRGLRAHGPADDRRTP